MRRRVHFDSEPVPEAVGRVRSLLVATLATWRLGEVLEVAKLCTSELVANAVVHARTALRVGIEYVPPDLLIEVHDRAPTRLPRPGHPSDESELGRGLMIVQALSSAWGYRLVDDGKIVWCAFDTRPTEEQPG